MRTVHPTAIVSTEADLGEDVHIGPFCIIEGRVKLGEGVNLLAAVHLRGPLEIGARTILYPGACAGFPAQDVKVAPGDPTAGAVIGSDTILREHATVHAATSREVPTRVGDRVFMMVGTHVGHDAQVGSGVTMVNGVGLAGHVEVGDGATFGGGAVIHQFCRVGRLAFVSGGTAASMDIPPYCTLHERNRLGGLNTVGMRRAGIPRDQITRARAAFREVFRRTLPRDEMVALLEARSEGCPVVAEMARFMATSKRGICAALSRPPRLARASAEPDAEAALADDADGG
jgi:UDP-N-acetylglucosamine acyltransferase